MADNQTSTSARVITFNCLTPYYAREEWFPGVKPKFLDSKYRLQRLKTLLQSWFKVNFIIALQELNDEWSNIVAEFCKTNNYHFVYSTYSGGVMGVGIAYPLNHYTLIAQDIFNAPAAARAKVQRMAETLANNKEVNGDDLNDDNETIPLPTERAMKKMVRSFAAAENKAFENSMVSILLRAFSKGADTEVEFLVSTYHVPCRFTTPLFMGAQVREVLARQSEPIDSLFPNIDRESMGLSPPAKIIPILMADCNITPDKFEYHVMVGDIEEDLDLQNMGLAYEAIGIPFRPYDQRVSVFVKNTGSEPNFTNVKFADPNVQNSEDFIETIDYILIPHDAQVEIKSTKLGLTPPEGQPIRPYPNAICPSDHLPLSASLVVQ